MTQNQRTAIIQSFKNMFRDKLIPAHIRNTKKLDNIKAFKSNPFLQHYLAKYLCGEVNAVNIARILIYPRVLGTSITTSFGSQVQNFIVLEMKGAFGTMIGGCDIEFEDHIDGRRKYAQLKSGPQALNKDDVPTVTNAFRKAQGIASQNRLPVRPNDFVLCLLYSEKNDWDANVKSVEKEYPVYSGNEFWHRLTGDGKFMDKLIVGIEEVVDELDATNVIEETINKLAKTIQTKHERA